MFLICVMLKVILKASKQIFNFFFTVICHNLTPGIYRARKEKKSAFTLLKKTALVWQTNSSSMTVLTFFFKNIQ